jgi:hypothetical protein
MATMSRLTFVPFAETHIAGAARLLAERHAAHRLLEPLLPQVSDFGRQVANEFEDATGTAAIADGDVAGYLIGKRREDEIGPHVWSGLAGHAAGDPELVRDLYAKAASAWVDAGLTRHFVFAPSSKELLDPWFRLTFGISGALAIRQTSAGGGDRSAVDVRVRLSTPADLPDVARLAAVLETELNASPSFDGFPVLSEQQHLKEWSTIWTDDRFVHFVAERDGRVVGHTLLYHRPSRGSQGPREQHRPGQRGEPARRPGLGSGSGHDGPRARLGEGTGLLDDDNGLADVKPFGVEVLAAQRLPGGVPAPLPFSALSGVQTWLPGYR